MANVKRIIEQAYSAFNKRNIDGALALMTEDVSWPKASVRLPRSRIDLNGQPIMGLRSRNSCGYHVPPGFRTEHLLVTSLTAPGDLYKDRNIDSAAWQPLLDAVRQLPGVKDAALSTVMPLKNPVEWLTIVYKTNWTHSNGDTRSSNLR